MNFNNIIHYEKIDSTQKEAWKLYQKSYSEALIIADTQTAGIGTHGRSWVTGKGNIALSMLFTLEANISSLDNLTYKIAQIILEIFHNDYQIDLDIKLPNDLMINKRKVGGILVESKLQKDKVKALVIGIGLNILTYPQDSEINAISIYEATNKKVDKDKLIIRICTNIKNELQERNLIK